MIPRWINRSSHSVAPPLIALPWSERKTFPVLALFVSCTISNTKLVYDIIMYTCRKAEQLYIEAISKRMESPWASASEPFLGNPKQKKKD